MASGRPGGNPGLKDYQFEAPFGVRVPRNKTYAITVEPQTHEFLKLADKEKIRLAIIQSLLDQGFEVDASIVEYYLSL